MYKYAKYEGCINLPYLLYLPYFTDDTPPPAQPYLHECPDFNDYGNPNAPNRLIFHFTHYFDNILQHTVQVCPI
ncbi:hypothetical protein, partial [Neisseria meningitidis]|uniref:hypothetical protein n=1 Tax=Neisseria meningitidis TaxID=487 RepID=UPI001C877145